MNQSTTAETAVETPVPPVPTATLEPTQEVNIPIVEPNTPTPLSLPTAAPVIPTEPPATIEPSPTVPEPTATEAPAQLTAVVSSGVGVWLRANPSTTGEQIEWLLQGTELVVLDGISQGETFSWQQVQAPSGEVGWVAVDFIQISGS